MADYFDSLKKSFTDAYRNPSLFVPLLTQALVTVLLLLLFLVGGAAMLFSAAGLNILLDAQSFVWTAQLVLFAIIFALVGLLALLVVGAWFTAGLLGMVNDVTDGKRATGQAFFAAAKAFYVPVLLYTLLRVGLFLLAALPFLVVLVAFLGTLAAPKLALIVLLAVFLLVFVVLAVFLGFGLFFAEPALIRDRLSAWQAAKRSFRLLRDRTGYVVLSALTVIVVALVVAAVASILSLPGAFLAAAGPGGVVAFVLLLIVRLALQFFLALVILLFTFRMYADAEEKKSASRSDTKKILVKDPPRRSAKKTGSKDVKKKRTRKTKK